MTAVHWVPALAAAAAGVPSGWAAGAVATRFRDPSPDPEAPQTSEDPGDPGDPQPPAVPPLGRRARLAAGLLTVVLFAAMGLRFGASPALPAFCYLAAAGVALGVIDARLRRLPDALTLPSYPAAAALLGLAAVYIPNGVALVRDGLFGAVAALAFFLLIAIISPSGIGWGDVKLSGVVGMYLGWLGMKAFVVGMVAGFVLPALAGIALIVAGRATRKTQLPFGPYLLAGAVAVILLSPLLGS